MKLHNGALTGRGDVPLSISTEDGDSQGMSVAGILEVACYYKSNLDAQADVADLATMRKLNKILDAVEKPECCIEIDDDNFEFIKESIENIVVRSWPIHAPQVIDQLDEYKCDSDSCDNCDCGD